LDGKKKLQASARKCLLRVPIENYFFNIYFLNNSIKLHREGKNALILREKRCFLILRQKLNKRSADNESRRLNAPAQRKNVFTCFYRQ